MPFSVSEFNAKLSKYGLAKDNLFLVKVIPPDLGADIPAGDLSFFCNSLTLPPLNLSTVDVQRQGYGVAEKRPTGLPYDNLNTTFMVDSTFRVKEFYHRWMQSITNFDNSKGYNYEYRSMLPFEMAYQENYRGTIEIGVYSFNEESILYLYRFGNAYPVALGDITTAWANNNSFMIMPVQFAFDTYEVQGFGQSIKSNRINSSRGFGGGGVDGFITRLGNFGQALDAFGVKTPIQDIVNQYTSVASQINGAIQAPQTLFN